MLPAVNSLFLARSALILAKPADKMYPAINKFFLRLENHGAHINADLPAFMSLYCSAADGIGRARTERQWAVNLLKDGTLDEFCYKVTARRHAPELLLTSFESLAKRSDNDHDESEGLLLLDTIQNLLENGGILSFHHLVCTIGLFSWIKGVLQSRLSMPSFATSAMKHKIVKLLHSALDITIQNYTQAPPRILFEPAQLAKALMQLFTDTVESGEKSNKTSVKNVLFASCVSEVLWLLRELDCLQQKKYPDILIFAISHSGIPSEQAVALLNMVKGEQSTFYKAVGALCHLPIRLSKGQHKVVIQLCTTSLQCILDNHHRIDKSISVHVINRITMLIRYFECHLRDDVSLLVMILGARQKAVQFSESSDAWFHCLSSLVELNKDQNCDEKSISRQIELLKKIARHVNSN